MFRTKRSKERAKARGRMLAAQWIANVTATHYRTARIRIAGDDVYALVDRARDMMTHWTEDTWCKWLKSIGAARPWNA